MHLSGEAVDTVADYLTIFILIFVPIGAVYLESVLTQDTEAVRLGRLRHTAGAIDLPHVRQLQAKQINTRFDLIGIQNERLANRVGLHLALGGGFEPPATP